MTQATLDELEELLDSATQSLPKITSKKMFGCYALWVEGNVFALVWKQGRIGVKLPEEKSFESLMSISGAEPWKAGPMKMSHWILVPEGFHSKCTALKRLETRESLLDDEDRWTLYLGSCAELE